MSDESIIIDDGIDWEDKYDLKGLTNNLTPPGEHTVGKFMEDHEVTTPSGTVIMWRKDEKIPYGWFRVPVGFMLDKYVAERAYLNGDGDARVLMGLSTKNNALVVGLAKDLGGVALEEEWQLRYDIPYVRDDQE